MHPTEKRALQNGISPSYTDAFGSRHSVSTKTLEKILDALGDLSQTRSSISDEAIAAVSAFQGEASAPERMWIIGVQLYAVRSGHNWGHGDFGDLSALVDIAAQHGAAGIGLNPLHALFADRPEDASPYSPNSRLFLNPLYIDLESVPELDRLARPADLERLRATKQVDYTGIAAAKYAALREAFAVFRSQRDPARRQEFDAFQARCGEPLARFSAFETLRRLHGNDWRAWPAEWRIPDPEQLARLRETHRDEMEFVEYAQWLADAQLAACRDKARRLGLPIGLYLDVAVGVSPAGADAWTDQANMLTGLSVGAPPDLLNTAGQNWGLTTYNPVALEAADFDPFRRMLAASMRYAGAIRLDHVLGLNRIYLVPEGLPAGEGAYLSYPLQKMLAVVAEESRRHRSIVIGEDLGTVPETLRATLAEWGIWSYRVMLFERSEEGDFRTPADYPRNALVCFSTHDLPTFSGWRSGHDLEVKKALGLDPGENAMERAASLKAMKMALGSMADIDYPAAVRFLAETPSRLLSIPVEDILGLREQTNLPGTVSEHPNWRHRMPIPLEEFGRHPELQRIAAIAGRRS